MSIPDRIARRIRVDYRGCWIWQGPPNPRTGYGKTSWEKRQWLIHRLVWTLLVGPIAPGLTIEHHCRVRLCCNPDHLEPMTQGENSRRSPATLDGRNTRKANCPQGHPYSGVNVRGDRICRTCATEQERARRAGRAA